MTDEINEQAAINAGQRRINFELCEVDKRLIGILKEVVVALKSGAGRSTGTTGQLRTVDFGKLESTLDDILNASGKVADITPPGCQGPYPN